MAWLDRDQTSTHLYAQRPQHPSSSLCSKAHQTTGLLEGTKGSYCLPAAASSEFSQQDKLHALMTGLEFMGPC